VCAARKDEPALSSVDMEDSNAGAAKPEISNRRSSSSSDPASKGAADEAAKHKAIQGSAESHEGSNRTTQEASDSKAVATIHDDGVRNAGGDGDVVDASKRDGHGDVIDEQVTDASPRGSANAEEEGPVCLCAVCAVLLCVCVCVCVCVLCVFVHVCVCARTYASWLCVYVHT
jgi:hypothetical protein